MLMDCQSKKSQYEAEMFMKESEILGKQNKRNLKKDEQQIVLSLMKQKEKSYVKKKRVVKTFTTSIRLR